MSRMLIPPGPWGPVFPTGLRWRGGGGGGCFRGGGDGFRYLSLPVYIGSFPFLGSVGDVFEGYGIGFGCSLVLLLRCMDPVRDSSSRCCLPEASFCAVDTHRSGLDSNLREVSALLCCFIAEATSVRRCAMSIFSSCMAKISATFFILSSGVKSGC